MPAKIYALKVIDNMFEVQNSFNVRHFQKIAIKYPVKMGVETISSCAPQLWNLVAAEVKQSPSRSSSTHQGCSIKNSVLKILQNSQQNTSACLRPATLLKKRLWRRCFSVNFCEIFKNISGRLLKETSINIQEKIKTW